MIEVWLIFSLLAVGLKTTYWTLQKRLLNDAASSLVLGYITAFYALLMFVPIAAYILLTDPPTVSWKVYAIVAGLGVIEMVGLAMYLEALAYTDISLASPLRRMKPTFVALSEPAVLGTVFSPILLIASVSTAVGGYVVLLKDRNLLAPFWRLTERGPALALGTAFVYAGLSLGSRFGASKLSPFVYGAIIVVVMYASFVVVLGWKGQLPAPRDHFTREYAVIGGVGSARWMAIWIAYALAAATLVSVVNQLAILLDVLVGGALLKEGNMKQRLLGAVLILAGVIAVSVF